MNWLPFNIALAIIAALALFFIHRARRAHDRELANKRTRTFQGCDL